MTQFSKIYKQKLEQEWTIYIKNKVPLPENNVGIRDFIYASWRRSQTYQVNPFEVKDRRLSPSALKDLKRKNENLIASAHSYIQYLYHFVRGSNFLLALADMDGYVLDVVGDDHLIRNRAEKSGLVTGSCRSEEYAGTNGIGTCLVEKTAIQIWGNEHYIQSLHNYFCSAAPIRDDTGLIIGCLNVVGPMDVTHPHTLALTSASVDSIEKELKMRSAYREITAINNHMSITIQAIPSGVLMIDRAGRVTQYNQNACDILGISSDKLAGKHLSDFIDPRASTLDLTNIERDIPYNEIHLTTRGGLRLSLHLSASVIRGEHGEMQGTVLIIDELKKLHRLTNDISGFTATYTFDSILGESDSIVTLKRVSRIAAQSNSNVLILGESGTGKELLAQAIHNASHRKGKPFIAINCGSLPKGLIESELFGYEKGAFTGANQNGQPGKFELADGGTIFLDEIGDMPLELQASLLRVLQSKEIVRIGGKQRKEVDVRIIAATNTDLFESVRKKEFRSDLYYRLNVLYIEIPPLRERTEDISLLAEHFIKYQNRVLNKNVNGLSDEAMDALRSYHWPGNIRELENSMERAMNLAQADMLTIADLPAIVVSEKMPQDGRVTKSDKTYAILVDALQQERGNVSQVSRRLKIPKVTLYRRIQKYQINVNDYRLR